MKITAEIFEAHLKCHTKCWLRTINEPFSGNAYSEWLETRKSLYSESQTKQLITGLSYHEVALSPATQNFDIEKWYAAVNVKVEEQLKNYILETELHAIERVTSKNKDRSDEFIPIRFNFKNKLGNDDKLLLAFDAFVFTALQRRETQVGKIIHGDDSSAIRIKVSTLFEKVKQRINIIAELLSSPSPPELILNKHCSECEFQNRCRQVAKESDDLSLLSGMSENERARHRSKGIFSVNQLSYTFTPRRTPKRAKNPAKPHHFSLQALAIREKCVYIHGTPTLPECKSIVYLDIEGLPDRDFYYLIGMLIVKGEYETFHSFWADTNSDMATIFIQFADVISKLHDYRIFHYGDYDVTALKRVSVCLPKSTQEQFDVIIQKSVNILSLVYPHVYFPTYSNSLKEISSYFNGNSDSQAATGLDSIIWRMRWEGSRDCSHKNRLIEYNLGDCTALKQLTEFISLRMSDEVGTTEDGIAVSRTEDMKMVRPYWQLFGVKPYALADLEHVSKSAYFDYQREKVFIRTHPELKTINKRSAIQKKTLLDKPTKTVFVEATNCPECKSRKLDRESERSHIVVDLTFSRNGISKHVKRLVSWRYNCKKCGKSFLSEVRSSNNPERFGHGLASWCVYQNNVLGVTMTKVRKSLVDLFGLHLNQSMLDRTKDRIATFYEPLCEEILNEILNATVLHIDETTVRLRKTRGYVWVLSTIDKVYYFYRPTRETEFLRELLAPFRGVLVSDFYTGYDALPCEQQKCIVHLVRDIDDDLLRNPFDEELKRLAQAFGTLLRSIVSTIDRFGLRRRYLKKHKKEVRRFLESEVTKDFSSEKANKYAKRFKKYGTKMFTFLDHDSVPWNNNNAEHAIKRFAKYRRDTDGRYSEKTLKQYLALATIFETCEFNSVNVLKFLLSKEQKLDGLLRMAGRRTKDTKSSKNINN